MQSLDFLPCAVQKLVNFHHALLLKSMVPVLQLVELNGRARDLGHYHGCLLGLLVYDVDTRIDGGNTIGNLAHALNGDVSTAYMEPQFASYLSNVANFVANPN